MDSVHRPDGLSGRHEHESRLGADGREADEARVAREGQALAGAHRRAGAARQPPGRHGRLRAGPRHLQPLSVCLPRAGEDSRPVRGSLRRSAYVQLHHRRRGDGRSAARLAAKVRGVPRSVRADHPGVSRPAHDQRDLRPPRGRHRHSCRRKWRSTTAAPDRCSAAAASIKICAATAKNATRRCTTATPSK